MITITVTKKQRRILEELVETHLDRAEWKTRQPTTCVSANSLYSDDYQDFWSSEVEERGALLTVIETAPAATSPKTSLETPPAIYKYAAVGKMLVEGCVDEEDTLGNIGYLKDLECPKCDQRGPFRIGCAVLVEYDDDGPISHSMHEWDESSYCQCARCGRDGVIKDFISRQLPCD